ncbi:RNA helicase [Rhodoplanes elegans]|uniref:DEAD-box ATP-dependent RNA helicase RhpA n=1 Tax=Rhodoplanes elegans TaxID=29408 RepID=A0A327JZI0_9BRAD|nr:DEAD/DEAH box helicase [Rhodoplanes elegans]MBK5958864.1 RNA helicase [Rhodoplanes elegans]RAI30442.1 RNA helicase [Rhodoplanes elegans]
MTSFQGFGLAEPIARALVDENYVTPTPIQAQTIPLALEGRDVIGIAQTGTGKTAAFALPILNRLHSDPKPTVRKSCRVLVLSPTRELSGQILDSFKAYGRHMKVASDLAIGGVSMGRQVRAVLPGLDVMVATPGRLLDLVNSNALRLNAVEVLVLDEADRMLDMGFIHDIRKIVSKLPKDRQTLFFSATMPQQIAELAAQMLRDPARVSVTPAASTAERIDQRIVHVDKSAKPQILAEVLKSEPIDRCLVFTRTKHGADKVVRGLDKAGIASAAIHGNKSQNQRERVLAAFRTGEVRILIATDIAARGIDVEGVSHVVNYDLPNIPESYVHRIGRTARAGAEGIAISFCDSEELPFLRDIEKLIRFAIPATDRRTGGRPLPASRPAQQGARGRNGGDGRRDGEPRRAGGEQRRDGGRGRLPDRDRPRAEQPRRDRDEAVRAAPQRPQREPREAGRHPAERPQENRNRGHQAQPQRGRAHEPRAERQQAASGPQRQPARDNAGRPHRNGGQHPSPVRVGVPLAERPAQRNSGPAVEAALDQVAFLRRGAPGRRDTGHSVER